MTVFAFPNASRIGLHESTFSDSELSCADARRSSVDPFLVGWPHIARYFITILDDSVLPEPDSPEMMIDCEQPSTCAGEACGGGRERSGELRRRIARRRRQRPHLHRAVRAVGHRVEVRRQHADRLAAVRRHLLVAVARERLVRVDGDQDVPGVRVDQVLRVAEAQVEEQARLVQVHELRVVADAVQILRVHRLGDRPVVVLRRAALQLDRDVVRRLVVVHDLAEHVALGFVRKPELRLLLLLALLFGRHAATEAAVRGKERGKERHHGLTDGLTLASTSSAADASREFSRRV